MSALLKFKGGYLAEITRCPLCQSARSKAFLPAPLFDDPDVDTGYLARDGAQASIYFFCGFELAIDELGAIVRTRDCTEIGNEKASELDEEAEERFDEHMEAAP